ncbi:MAG: hypothetical protein KIT81_05550 [Alphaproteobacteria bacterium]|nr:hypothetical protein [Alphaproteobacteria bacterium]
MPQGVLGLESEPGDCWPARDPRPWRRAESLVRRFAATFPEIRYDIFAGTALANAQAFRLGPLRCVRLYGGLVRHRTIGLAGLAFALAHETGHHLGGPPADPIYPWLSSEAAADEWALVIGLPLVFGAARGGRLGARGLARRAALRAALGDDAAGRDDRSR